jgi:diguanylate cyclase (GGDEF)-like protein/PAS domain S-box-containing protein
VQAGDLAGSNNTANATNAVTTNLIAQIQAGDLAFALYDIELEQQHKRVEEALRKSEARYRILFESINDAVFVHDLNEEGLPGRFLQVNEVACRRLGYTKEELLSLTLRDITIPEEYERIADKRIGLASQGDILAETIHVTKDGRKIPVESNIRQFQYLGRRVALSISRDITDRKQAEKALRDSEKRYRELSIVDDLTQLYNSRHFYFQLKVELDRSNRYEQPLTLLLLDLDNFKAFNDAYGHIEGDQVLRRLGQAVKRCLRQTDSAYRYGGEEFTIILPMTTSADGAVTAERIRTEFKKETFSPAPGQDVHVTVSIGLAQYKPQEEMKAFVHRVDQLMYQGKKNGKDKVCSGSAPQEQVKW